MERSKFQAFRQCHCGWRRPRIERASRGNAGWRICRLPTHILLYLKCLPCLMNRAKVFALPLRGCCCCGFTFLFFYLFFLFASHNNFIIYVARTLSARTSVNEGPIGQLSTAATGCQLAKFLWLNFCMAYMEGAWQVFGHCNSRVEEEGASGV